MDPPLLVRAARGEPTPRPPVWILRQAGRYLPEYRKIRAMAGSFLDLCKAPRLAAEASLLPWRILDVDGVIVFSDILVVLEAMGIPVTFDEGPRLGRPIRRREDVAALRDPDPPRRLAYVAEAVRLLAEAVAGRVPVIGFAGAPFTLAAYAVAGGSPSLEEVRGFLYREPALFEELLRRIADGVTGLLLEEIAAGASYVQLFDTWAGALPPEAYRRFAAAATAPIIAEVHRVGVPAALFVRGASPHLEAMAGTGADVIALDWTVAPESARARVGERAALQGNLDPAVLLAGPEAVRERTRAMLEAFRGQRGYIANLGHGILPSTRVESARAFVETVKAWT